MPLLPEPTTQELEDHFFGSGAFTFGWFSTKSNEFPAVVKHWGPYEDDEETLLVTEQDFIRGIKMLAILDPIRTYEDLLDDMDAGDVDNCIQLAMFGEIRYS